jgi:hypothetical protein
MYMKNRGGFLEAVTEDSRRCSGDVSIERNSNPSECLPRSLPVDPQSPILNPNGVSMDIKK